MGCHVNHGAALIVEWTWLKGGAPVFGDGYFTTPDAALDDWRRRKGKASVYKPIGGNRSEIENIAREKWQCDKFTSGFMDF